MTELEILRLLFAATKRIGAWIIVDLGIMFEDGWNTCVNHGWIDIDQDRKCRLTIAGISKAASLGFNFGICRV